MKINFLKRIVILLLWTTIIVASVYFYINNVLPYFGDTLDPRKEKEKWWLIIHFAGAFCSLFLGPLQFWGSFRNRYSRWHRIAGKLYIGGSIISALMVFYLLSNYPLPGSIPSLGLLAIIWLFTTIAAYWFAINKNFKFHKEFMIRSYVCGLAFVFIRLLPRINSYFGIFNFMQDEELRDTIYEWMCWVYPLMITEFLLVWWPSIAKYKKQKK